MIFWRNFERDSAEARSWGVPSLTTLGLQKASGSGRRWIRDPADAGGPRDATIPAHRSAFVIAATSSFEPDPQRETVLIAWVNGTSSGWTRSPLRM